MVNKEVTRRDFVKGAAAGAVVVASSGILASCTSGSTVETGLPEKWDREIDVLIAGAGGAGLAAAIGAVEEGAKVLVLEKTSSSLTSSTSVCGGFITFSGTDIQQKHGITDTPDDFYKDMVEYGEETTPEVVRLYADSNLAYYELVKEIGVPFVDAISASPGCSIPRTHTVDPAKHVQLLEKTALERGAEILFRTPMKRLIINSNREVLGAIVESQGKEIYIKARKAVILATGGFTHSKDLLNECVPGLGNVLALSSPGHTGDGHNMAFALGCFMRGRPTIYSVQGMEPQSTTMKGYAELFLYGAIDVNKDGQRYISEDIYWSNKRTRLTLEQPKEGGIPILYQIIDKRAYDKAVAAGPPIGLGPDTIALLVEGATIGELGDKIGAKELKNTVDRYNHDIEVEGYDTVLGRRTMVGIGTPNVEKLDTPPFYAFRNTAWLAYNPTVSIIVNRSLHPVTVFDEEISRLYLAGEIMLRNVCGNHYIYGEATGAGGALGLVAGKNAAKEEPWE